MSTFQLMTARMALGLALVPSGLAYALPAHAEPGVVTTYGTGAPTRLVTLGDSVPAGTACDCDDFGKVLAADLATSDGGATVVNHGRPGATTATLLAQLDDEDVRRDLTTATVVTVTIGANNLSVDDAADPAPKDAVLRAELARALAEVKQQAPHARILVTNYWNVSKVGAVAAPLGPDYARDAETVTQVVNAAVRDSAREAAVRFVDMERAYVIASLDVTTLLAADGDHPNQRGHEVIAAAVKHTLTDTRA
ncbi:hypothetical protein GCM10027418_16720 [Mariniluteicoccus endophyticus]